MKHHLIINVGSVNIDEVFHVGDIVMAGQTISSLGYTRSNGGKGANQSVAIALATGRVCHVGKVGRDGAAIVEDMRRQGVDVEGIRVSESEATGRAIIQVNSAGNNAIVLHPGANHALQRSELAEQLGSLAREEGGFLLLQNEVNEVSWLISHGKELGLKICLNLAPCSRDCADLPLHLVDILNVNETEGNDLVKSLRAKAKGRVAAEDPAPSTSPVEQAAKNVEYLVSVLPQASFIVTLGEHGVLASYLDGGSRVSLQLPAYPTKVVETTGAGDTFVGYFLALLSKGQSFERSLRIAGKAASISVSRKGAMESIPTLVEVMQDDQKSS